MKNLVWFRNDLRIHDNEVLAKALEKGDVLPVYIFDPRVFGETSFGFKKTGPHRARFLVESVKALSLSLKEMGGELLIQQAKPEDRIPELVKKYEIDAVYFHEEVTSEETRIERQLESKLACEIHKYWGSTLFHVDDLVFDKEEIPDVFTRFRKKMETNAQVREEIELPKQRSFLELSEKHAIPTLRDLGVDPKEMDARAVLPFKGGERRALQRITEYFWDRDLLKEYKYTRNGLLGADYSSKLSPWLANGSVSPRRIYREVKRYEKERKKNQSTYWLIFELMWRDYFRFSAWKYGDQIFKAEGIQQKERHWDMNREAFQKWASGQTGIPFIDANMRELNETGFMSNRGRQNVASFLSQNLNLDWRMGAEYFESLLLDYDPCSNYLNWAYNSTVGHDPRNRYFNILNQANRYDKEGEYVKYWLTELEQVPAGFIHEPHTLAKEQQKQFELHIGDDYPEPMIDLEASYEKIKARD